MCASIRDWGSPRCFRAERRPHGGDVLPPPYVGCYLSVLEQEIAALPCRRGQEKRLPSCFVSPFFTASSHQCFFFFKHAMQLLQWREAVKWCTWRHHQTAIKSHCAPQVCAVMLQEMETCYTPADSHCEQYTNWSAPSYVIIFVVVLSQWLSQSPPAASPTPRYLW